MRNPPELSSEATAQALARRLEDYWAKRGFVLKTHLVPWIGKVNSQHGSSFWCVRSDMKNGMPVRRAVKESA